MLIAPWKRREHGDDQRRACRQREAYEAIARYSGQSDRTDADAEEQRIRTERAKRARDQELGDNDSQNENIESFLKAMQPSEEHLFDLFAEDKEREEEDAEAEEKTGKV